MAPQLVSTERMTTESTSVEVLWLDALQRMCVRAAHELKGALNGVSVNLEVVRSRSERPDAPASAVNAYAVAAGDQLGAAIAMTEAVLSLARPAREPVEIGVVIRRMDALLAPAARADGRRLECLGSAFEVGSTAAAGTVTRMALSTALLAALDASVDVVCAAGAADRPVIRIECRDGATLALDAAVSTAAAEHGVRVDVEASAISLSFPRSTTGGHRLYEAR